MIGGGFAGLATVRALKGSGAQIVLIDRRNFHLFQPLLYQVATSGLSPGEIATPLRSILKRRDDVDVMLGEVVGFDVGRRCVRVLPMGQASGSLEVAYDTLVVAAGARHSYFGNDHWRPLAPGLKSVEDALELRRRILSAFEAAEIERDSAARRAWLTFVVVGGGPTGVEMAGQIAEIARDTMRRDFRQMDPKETRVLLVEGAERILLSFDPRLSAKAARSLASLGVTVRTGFLVSDILPGRILVGADDETEAIDARTIVWAAGVAASKLAGALAEATAVAIDRGGRISVQDDLTIEGHPEIFALGDMAVFVDVRSGRPLPGVAPVAMQQGRHAAKAVRARVSGGAPPGEFRYVNKGNLATIGRLRAIGEIGPLRLSGIPAWLAWLGLHITYLIGVQNRLLVLIRWTSSFITRNRGARLITGEVRPAERDADGPNDHVTANR